MMDFVHFFVLHRSSFHNSVKLQEDIWDQSACMNRGSQLGDESRA